MVWFWCVLNILVHQAFYNSINTNPLLIFLLGKNWLKCVFFVDGKQCILKKSYSDGCNHCVCGNNMQDDNGVWKPIIYCTQKMCYVNEKAYTPVSPPEDFWKSWFTWFEKHASFGFIIFNLTNHRIVNSFERNPVHIRQKLTNKLLV